MSLLYLQREQVLFHRVSHVAPPWFYSSPGWTNQTLGPEKAFSFFSLFAATVGVGELRGIPLYAI